MWETISHPWQEAFKQGWESFKNGSIPIGAVITDENGTIIAVGRNRVYEHTMLNPKIAHAELVCLLNLDFNQFPHVKQYILYACMEPCPMCFGAIVMGNLCKVKVAARDSYCGATQLCETNAYIQSKRMSIQFELGILEAVQLTLQTYFELKISNGKGNHVIDIFHKDNPNAIRLAHKLYEEKYLDSCVVNQVEFNEVFNVICSSLLE